MNIDPAEFTRRVIIARAEHGNIIPGIDLAFEWGLANSDGAWFILLVEPHHSFKDVDTAKTFLKNHRDVVRLDTVRPRKVRTS